MNKDWLQPRLSVDDRRDHVVETIKILATYIRARSSKGPLQKDRSLLDHLDACIDSYERQWTESLPADSRHLRDHLMAIFMFFVSHGRYHEAEKVLEPF